MFDWGRIGVGVGWIFYRILRKIDLISEFSNKFSSDFVVEFRSFFVVQGLLVQYSLRIEEFLLKAYEVVRRPRFVLGDIFVLAFCHVGSCVQEKCGEL